jgi:hypothetical protein
VGKVSTNEEQKIDTSFDVARVLHRVVRGMNDGECPRCHILEPISVKLMFDGTLYCVRCHFTITKKEVKKVMDIWASIANKNLEIFENWRKENG